MKKLKNYIKNNYLFLILLLLVVSVLFNFNQCKNATVLENTIVSNNEARNDTIEYFKNELGQIVAEKKAFQTTIKEMDIYIDDILLENSQLEKTIKSFNKPKSASSVDIKVEVNDVDIKFANPVAYTFEREFKKTTNNYNLYGKVNQYGIYDFRFLATNTQTLATGTKTTGLFSIDFISELVNSNPIFTATDMTNIDFTTLKKRFGVSLFAGPVITPEFQIVPAIGIGISYNLFRF